MIMATSSRHTLSSDSHYMITFSYSSDIYFEFVAIQVCEFMRESSLLRVFGKQELIEVKRI